ncbi:MAG TPA: type II secretion system protein [Acidobacteriaceae bacterium]
MLLRNSSPEPENQEEGYLLLTVLVMVFLLLLALSVAAPRVAKEIQRDKEQEALQRGLQYKRAIRMYYKKFGAYPTDIKQLEKTNEIRFLRKRYTDPITGKDDWRLIHMGEAKVPPMGFFGQPLQQGMSSVTTGLNGGAGGSGSAGGDPGTTGGAMNGASPTNTGSSSFGFNNSGGSSNVGSGSSGFGFSNSNTGATPGSVGGMNSTGTNGPGSNLPGANTPGNGNSTGTTGSGNTFGGGPIVGVGIPVKKPSMLEYHKQKKYSDWEFVYDPQEDLVMAGGVTGGGDANGNPGGLGANGTNGSPNSSGSPGSSGSSGSSGFGFNNGGSSGGSGSSGFGFGNSGSNPSPTPPSMPQPSNPQQ